MSTNNQGATQLGSLQLPSNPMEGACLIETAGTPTTPKCLKDSQHMGGNVQTASNRFSAQEYCSGGLGHADGILPNTHAPIVLLPITRLWESYPQAAGLFSEVQEMLKQTGFLKEDGKWDPAKVTNNVEKRGEGKENIVFRVFTIIFNLILGYLQLVSKAQFVKEMVHAGPFKPKSTRINTSRPDAFLRVDAAGPLKSGSFQWRNLTCPFEFKFGDGNSVDNNAKTLWSLHHLLRCDPIRMFSFGCTVRGKDFQILLLSRVAPFAFESFNWLENPDLLIQFFTLLGTSSATDLGFDRNIERAGESDFAIQFTVGGTKYLTKQLLYDVGADKSTGRGSRVFEVQDAEAKDVCVIKDCWVEDRPGKELEHAIMDKIEKKMPKEIHEKHFLRILSHRKTEMSGGFGSLCKDLRSQNVKLVKIRSDAFVPISSGTKSAYIAGAHVSDQSGHLEQTRVKPTEEFAPHSRFRYQVVYQEKGMSLFEVTDLAEAFTYIAQAAEGLHQLHQVGWVHRDPSPGNIIIINGRALISDVEFAKERSSSDLEATRPISDSSRSPREVAVGTMPFMAVEVEVASYLYFKEECGAKSRQSSPYGDDKNVISEADGRPSENVDGASGGCPIPHQSIGDAKQVPRPVVSFEDKCFKPIFLYNPLHDYESIWWIAVWFVFHCQGNNIDQRMMERARSCLYQNRVATFVFTGFTQAYLKLPAVLQPMGITLDNLRKKLIRHYQHFENLFDGSKMMAAYYSLKSGLLVLKAAAQGLLVGLSVARLILRPAELELDVATSREEGSQERMEGEGEGRNPAVVEDPSPSQPGAHTGKRRKEHPPLSEENPTVKRTKLSD